MDSFVSLSLPWQQAIESFLSSLQNRSGSWKGRATYESNLRSFFRFTSKQPNEITRADVRSFLAAPSFAKRDQDKSAPVSPSTYNSRLSVLKSLYSYLSNYEVDGAPLWSGALPTQGLHQVKIGREYKAMAQKELETFFSCIDRSTIIGKRDFALYSFYLLTCRRRSELQRLRYGDLSYEMVAEGAQRRMSWVFHFRGKGKSRVDDKSELPQLVYDALVDYWRADRRYGTMQADDPLFCAVHAGREHLRPLCGEAINKRFKQICAQAGLSKKFVIHSLRHSSARIRIEQGEDLRAVQHALRHVSIATTDIYVSALVSSGDPGAARIEASLPFLASSASGSEASR